MFSNALSHFSYAEISGQTAIFQGILLECLELNTEISVAYHTHICNTQ